jgi:hypothetical protein
MIYRSSCPDSFEDMDGWILNKMWFGLTFPKRVPTSFLVRFTGRRDGSWRRQDRPNTKRTGSHRITVVEGNTPAVMVDLNFDYKPGRAKKLSIPVGQPTKVHIRAIYDDKKGPWFKTVMNDREWWTDYLSSDLCQSGGSRFFRRS